MSSAKIKPARRDSSLKTAAIKKIKSPSNKAENQPFDAQDSVLPFTYIAPYQEKAGETYMNKKQLAHFKNILTTWQAYLIEQNKKTIDIMRQENKVHADIIDAAAYQEEFENKIKARNRDRVLMKKIEAALLKINDGTYGFCEASGEDIGIKRLEARPTTLYCIAEQEKHEHVKKFFAERNDD